MRPVSTFFDIQLSNSRDGAFANTNITYLDLWGCEPLQIGAAIFGEQGGNGLEVRVPAAYLEWYENAFAGYDVRIL